MEDETRNTAQTETNDEIKKKYNSDKEPNLHDILIGVEGFSRQADYTIFPH